MFPEIGACKPFVPQNIHKLNKGIWIIEGALQAGSLNILKSFGVLMSTLLFFFLKIYFWTILAGSCTSASDTIFVNVRNADYCM